MRALVAFSVFALLGSTANAAATITVGGASDTSGSYIDGAEIGTYILGQAFGGAYKVTSFSLYADGLGEITPLLLQSSGTPSATNFTVIGVGASRQITDYGQQSFSFSLQSGTDITTANTYFGFANHDGAVVGFHADNLVGTFLQGSVMDTVGQTSATGDMSSITWNTYGALNNRGYHINATGEDLAAGVPEPASWAMMLGGFGLIGGALRSRRKAIVTFA